VGCDYADPFNDNDPDLKELDMVWALGHGFPMPKATQFSAHQQQTALRAWPVLPLFSRRLSLALMAALCLACARAQEAPPAEFRARFLQLCDLVAAKVSDANSAGSFFVDSYAVRTLCAAYDLTGNQRYLEASRQWSGRMVGFQDKMVPAGAYYMHYNRQPGQTNGDWYVADSASIGMAVLATAVRCSGAERQHLVDSVQKFAGLVMSNYIKPSGGVTDGLWHQSSDEWWCSSGIFGSLSFLLYQETGEERYLHCGLRVADWLDQWDLTKPQPFPLSEQGPAMLMYVMECYSAGWPLIIKDEARKEAATAKVAWCLHWITGQQAVPLAQRPWPVTKGWGMKFGGLPFHEYVFSRHLPQDKSLLTNGDQDMRQLASVVFDGAPKVTQLSMFMLMSYAERLKPGAIYREEAR